MKKLLAIAALASATLITSVPAEAREGCGRGWHRGPYGRCVRNLPPPPPRSGVVIREDGATLVIGNYYRGRGYWDGRRYWRERYRYNNGWRYR